MNIILIVVLGLIVEFFFFMYCDLIICYYEMKNYLIFGDEKNKLDFFKYKNICIISLCV